MRFLAFFLLTKKGSSLLSIIIKMFFLAFVAALIFGGCESVYRLISGGEPSIIHDAFNTNSEIDRIEREFAKKRHKAEN